VLRGGAVKLIMTLLVRDEQDIIRANIAYHLSQGVDFFIAMDNRSEDETPGFLKSYETKGLLRYIYEGDDDYNQHAWVTRMARMAYTDHGADWVINNDADEFWWPIEGSLHETFSALPADINILRARRHNFPAVEPSDVPFYHRMIYRDRESLNSFGRPLPPKVAHRGCADIIVDQGNHAVKGLADPQVCEGQVEIFHFPVRSYDQIENKIAKGGAAYENNRELPEIVGRTWRQRYQDLKRDNNLNSYYEECCHDETRRAAKLASGEIVIDRRLSDHFATRLGG
jgi:hypothetical protein